MWEYVLFQQQLTDIEMFLTHSVVNGHSSAIRRAAMLFYKQTTTGEPPEVLVTGLFQLLQVYSNFRFVKTGSAFVHRVSLMISRGTNKCCFLNKKPFLL